MQLNVYIGDVAAKYTFATATLIGETFERRQMIVLSLLKAGRGKPNIWIEAGIHAREWISPAMAIYIIDQLLNNDQGAIHKGRHLFFEIFDPSQPLCHPKVTFR